MVTGRDYGGVWFLLFQVAFLTWFRSGAAETNA